MPKQIPTCILCVTRPSPLHVDVNYDPNAYIPSGREYDLQMQFNQQNEKDCGVSVVVQPSYRQNDD